MLSQDDFTYATQYSEQTHQFLSQHQLAPNPVNYSVIYLYVSNNHGDLTKEINEHLNAHNNFDNIFMEQMFDQYLSNSQKIENDILDPLYVSLSETVNRINKQVTHGKKTSIKLEKIDSALAKFDQGKSLNDVVNYLIGTIKTSHQQHISISEQLEKTSDEVHQLKSKLEETRQDAILDALTGLLNRRGGDEKLQELELTDVHSSLLIDIDYFKKFNDDFGHFIGDKVLQRVAKVIRECVNTDDVTMRFGGEEFLVVLVNKAQSEASLIAEKIRHTVNTLKLKQKQTNLTLPPISVSIGIAEVDDDLSWSDLFKRADEALYQAKNSGRNRCVIA